MLKGRVLFHKTAIETAHRAPLAQKRPKRASHCTG